MLDATAQAELVRRGEASPSDLIAEAFGRRTAAACLVGVARRVLAPAAAMVGRRRLRSAAVTDAPATAATPGTFPQTL